MNKLLPKREQNSNKGTFGTVLNLSGSKSYSGAAILSSLAALKSGAGKVILCSSENTLSAAAIRALEVILCKRENLNFDGVSSVILGCGLSTDNDALKIFTKAVNSVGEIPLIIDADGLNILSENFCKLPKNTVLTPHPKEMSRLMGVSLQEVIEKPQEIICACVEKYNATVVLKLHETLVMDTSKSLYINTTGNSALAKAGSGDILSGIIGGLLAQKMNCFDAAKLGVYIHGLTGDIASKTLSEYSVLASDLLNYIGHAFKALSSST